MTAATPEKRTSTTMRVFLIDNYDSFTYNLYQYLSELGADVTVQRNDKFALDDLDDDRWGAIVISPGPGRPADAGNTPEVVRRFAGHIPILGVCLGHQAIGEVFGGRIVRAPSLFHGKVSRIMHDGRSIFRGLPNPIVATRYHSLVIEPSSMPAALEVTARTEDGVIMGVRHREYLLEGVQFHPESALTPEGKQLLANFLELAADSDHGTGAPPLPNPPPRGGAGTTPGLPARDEG